MLPTLAAALFAGWLAYDSADKLRQTRLLVAAETLAGSIDQVFAGMQSGLAMLQVGGLPATPDALADMRGRARLLASLYDTRISLLDTTGVETMTTRAETGPASDERRRRPAWSPPEAQTVLATGRPAITHVLLSTRTATARPLVLAPVCSGAEVTGVLVMSVSSDRLVSALRLSARHFDGTGMLVDPTGRVAAATTDVARLTGQMLPPLPSPTWHAEAGLAGAPGWRVVTVADRAQQAQFGTWWIVPVTTLAGVLMTLAFGRSLGDRLSRPLAGLIAQARTLASGSDRHAAESPAKPLAASHVAEFDALQKSLQLADALLRRRGAAERMALREARTGHELLASVVNGTAEPIYVKDLDLRYVMVNRAALRHGKVPREEWQVMGRGSADLFPAIVARRIEAADLTVLATGRMTSFEQEYDADPGAPDTTRRCISMTLAPWLDAEGQVKGVVSVSRDITRQRAADARMRALQADLLRATRLSSMGAMASGLAHELNQPLAAATNYLNAGGRLMDRAEQGDTAALRAARGAVTDAAQQMLRAGAIVRRLRDFVERGEAELQPHDLGELLREACELAGTDGLTAGLALHLHLHEPHITALVDRTQIQQVLLNLIRNAAEAISTAAPNAGEITVTAGRSAQSIVVAVADNGPGFVPGLADRLFEPFVSTKPAGLGIGLAICRTIVEGHGGTLTARSNPPKGVVFDITLPAITLPGD